MCESHAVVVAGRPFADRYEIDSETGCWNWQMWLSWEGYGYIRLSRHANLLAHRVSYILQKGAIPEGLVLDHLCCNPKCVNPDHLEPVTIGENNRRGTHARGLRRAETAEPAAAFECCKHGHPRTAANTYAYISARGWIQRTCRACGRIGARKRKERRIAFLQSANGKDGAGK